MKVLAWLFWCLTALCSFVTGRPGGHGGKGEHVVIKIPYHVKTIKHTHTIYKTIHHGHGGGGGGGGGHLLGHSHGDTPRVGSGLIVPYLCTISDIQESVNTRK